ncbi:DUF4405 domain-containing protein [Puniceicoccus vermicola]|uniref:DUF4405 domain-containing protein n=1 Tax=Puniceicoccus vermicola TaxID=388746 RepID=A0A7X1AVK0_9BACT|nr:DUF4405 domain-containing protein [Puniceicoccus vermicola]MBC2600617.1 DUF4405 domain-containing protein [Puniceicoccus vermicola]
MKASTETTFRRILNLVLYWAACVMVGTGLLLKFRFPHGHGQGRGRVSILGLSHHDWTEVHLWTGYIFIILILLHLWLARKWLLGIAAKRKTWPVAAGMVFGGVIILGLLVLPRS